MESAPTKDPRWLSKYLIEAGKSTGRNTSASRAQIPGQIALDHAALSSILPLITGGRIDFVIQHNCHCCFNCLGKMARSGEQPSEESVKFTCH